MASQIVNKFGSAAFLDASVLNVQIGSGETIVLDNIPFSGLLTGTVFVYSITGTTTAVNVYGSADGVNYASLKSAAIASVSVGTAGLGSFTGIPIKFIRITATGTSTANVYVSAVSC